MFSSCLRQLKDGATLSIVLAPNAKRSGFLGLHDGALKIAVRAPALEGKANSALIEFLSGTFRIPKSSIELIKGHASKRKLISIKGLNKKQLELKLLELLPSDRA